MAKKIIYSILIFPNSVTKHKKNDKQPEKKIKNDFEINIDSTKKNNNLKQHKQDTRSYSKPDREIMKNGDIFYRYIKDLFYRKLYHKVLANIDQFRELFPDHSNMNEVNMLKGKTLAQLRQYDRAILWYQTIMNEQPDISDSGKILLILGKLYEMKGDINNAKISYIKIFSLLKDPQILSEAHFSLGKIYFSSKEYNKGIIELELLIKKYPEAIQKREIALYLLGEMYYKKSAFRNHQKAYVYFRILTEEFPKRYYSRKARKKMKFLEKNFIKYY